MIMPINIHKPNGNFFFYGAFARHLALLIKVITTVKLVLSSLWLEPTVDAVMSAFFLHMLPL